MTSRLWKWPGGNSWVWPLGRHESFDPLTIEQSLEVQIVASCFEPIVCAQTAAAAVVASEFAPIPIAQTVSVAIVAEDGSAVSDPSTILGANLTQWVRADLGVTVVTGVSNWADQSGNGRDYVQATGSAQPALNAADATLDNQATITGDGSNDFLACDGFSPGIPLYCWIIFKQISWTLNDRLVGATSGTGPRITQTATTPDLRPANAANGGINAAGTIGTWFRLECAWDDAAGDYLKIGATSATGDTGATGGTGRRIFCNLSSGFGNMAIAELVYADVLPNAGQRAALDAYGAARYPSASF